MAKINISPLWEAVKEPLREILIAALPGVLVYLQTIDASWAVALYLFLRGTDKYLHEKSKKTGETNFVSSFLSLDWINLNK